MGLLLVLHSVLSFLRREDVVEFVLVDGDLAEVLLDIVKIHPEGSVISLFRLYQVWICLLGMCPQLIMTFLITPSALPLKLTPRVPEFDKMNFFAFLGRVSFFITWNVLLIHNVTVLVFILLDLCDNLSLKDTV